MNEPIDTIIDGKYEDFMINYWKINLKLKADDAKQYSVLKLDLSKLKMKLKISKEQEKDVIISFLVKRFYSKLYMYSFMYSENLKYEDKPSSVDFKHPFLNNVDILNIPSKYIGDIKPFSTKDSIALIENLLDRNKDVKKAISMSKELFIKYSGKAYFFNILTSISLTTSLIHALSVGRSFHHLITSLGNMSKDMIKYDTLVIEIINTMYERKS